MVGHARAAEITGNATDARWPWQGRWCLPIFHPSYLLRNPSREPETPKWHTWQDLKAVRSRLDQLRAAPDLAPDSAGDP